MTSVGGKRSLCWLACHEAPNIGHVQAKHYASDSSSPGRSSQLRIEQLGKRAHLLPSVFVQRRQGESPTANSTMVSCLKITGGRHCDNGQEKSIVLSSG